MGVCRLERVKFMVLIVEIARKCLEATDFSRRRMLTTGHHQLPAAPTWTWLRILPVAVSFSTTIKSERLVEHAGPQEPHEGGTLQSAYAGESP